MTSCNPSFPYNVNVYQHCAHTKLDQIKQDIPIHSSQSTSCKQPRELINHERHSKKVSQLFFKDDCLSRTVPIQSILTYLQVYRKTNRKKKVWRSTIWPGSSFWHTQCQLGQPSIKLPGVSSGLDLIRLFYHLRYLTHRGDILRNLTHQKRHLSVCQKVLNVLPRISAVQPFCA